MNMPGALNFARTLVPLATIILTPLPSLLGEAAPSPAPVTEVPQASPAPTAAKKKVYEGMPASELQALIGKPEKIIQVATPPGKTGHAEIWIYKRRKSMSTDVVTIGTRPITIKQKRGDTYVDVVVSNEPITKNQTTETFDVAAFLIVNGQYITTTRTEEKQLSFL